jgi:hypothetical protein
MSPSIVLTAAVAAVLVSAFTRSRRQKREDALFSVGYDSSEVLANNLKAATKKVDSLAARVELTLKPLMAV